MHDRFAPPSVDRLVADLARRQDGVISHDQLVGLGLDRGAIAHRIASGRLHALHVGVYAVGHTALSARGRRFGALLACGEGAALSHQTAGDEWCIRPTSSPRIHVTVPLRNGRRRPGLTIHRPRRLPEHEVTTRDGLTITTVARTLLDLADVVPLDHLRRAVERAEALQLLDQQEVGAVLAEHPGRRIRRLARALEHADFGPTRSPLESDFLALCKDYGLPRPEVNVPVAGYEADFFFRDANLVVETDGWRHHRTKRSFETDRRRDVAFAKAGLRHVRFTHDRIAHEAAEVARDVSSLLAL